MLQNITLRQKNKFISVHLTDSNGTMKNGK